MKAMKDQTADKSNLHARLDTIRMSEEQRSHAYTSLHNGELVAELVLRAVADMRAIAQFAGRAAANLMGAIKAMLAKPAQL